MVGVQSTSLALKQRLEKTHPSKSPSQVAPVSNAPSAAKEEKIAPLNPIFPEYTLIDTREKLSELHEALENVPRNGEPNLLCHAVNQNTSYMPRISFLAIFVDTTQKTYILDITQLGQSAFQTVSEGGSPTSLGRVLEDLNTPKVFTSTKNTTAALHRHHKILMQAVIDLEVLENMAAGEGAKKHSLITSDLDPFR